MRLSGKYVIIYLTGFFTQIFSFFEKIFVKNGLIMRDITLYRRARTLSKTAAVKRKGYQNRWAMANIKMNKKKYKGYVIRVSLSKYCRRDLNFSGSFTLEDLADMILFAFDFDNDHLHAFFMDGKPYSDAECYYSQYAEEEGIASNEIKVEALELNEKQKFLFVFDFGDDWRFKCEVIKIIDIFEGKPHVSNILGEAPEQYPDYDAIDKYDDEQDNEDAEISRYVKIEPELFKAAFDFKRAKTWSRLGAEDVFAVKLSDGKIGYVTVLGGGTEVYGLVLYLGDDGARHLYELLTDASIRGIDKAGVFEFQLELDCIMMTFVCKSEIFPEFIPDIQQYAKENGISLRGKNSFPYFMRYLPQRCPWSVTNEKDRQYLIQALNASTELAKRLENCEKSELRFGELPIIPLITKKKNGYSCGSAMLPKPSVKKYDPLKTKLQFKNYKTRSDLECKIINLPDPVYNETDGVPEYPVVTLFINTKKQTLMHTNAFPCAFDISDDMLDSLVTELSSNKICPKTITVSDERTKALLSDICERCGVELIIKESLPHLDGMIKSLYSDLL